ncbi:putative extracellular nuclease [Burkholderiales bacterium JOSHI_001]|nr:putative extracellular nuclease [Burkholderiales bacterium JOSHI_001]
MFALIAPTRLRRFACALLGALLLGLGAVSVQAAVLISQVYGGGGNAGATWRNDFVELHNTGAVPVDVAGWSLQYTSAAGISWGSQKVTLAGSLPAGGYLLVQLGSGGAAGALLPAAQASGTFNMSATAGKLALLNTSVSLAALNCPSDPAIVDLVGYGTTADCFEGAARAPVPSATASVQRLGDGCQDTQHNGNDFVAGVPTPRHSASPPLVCGTAGGVVASCASFNTVQGIAGSQAMSARDVDSRVTAVTLTSTPVPGITLGALAPSAVAGATARVRVEAAASVPQGNYAVALRFDNDVGASGSCAATVSVLAPPVALTGIPAVQGSGASSPLVGSARTVRGVVTGVFPGLRGYYIQDEAGDGNSATSDGLFVFNFDQPITVEAGERVQVSGTVVEFAGQPGNPTVTELSFLTQTAKLGLGSIAPTEVNLPEVVEGDLERYEGMLVTLNGPLTVSQNFFQGRYGQVTLAAQGRLFKPTQLHRPGTPATLALADDNARRRIVLDDGQSSESLFSGAENPNPIPYIGADNTLRAGDTVASLTGVIDFGRNTSGTGVDAVVDYKIHPTVPPVFTRLNARNPTPPAVGGTHKVASFNVLNYFTTFSNGTTASGGTGAGCLPSNTTGDCRGADNAAEFARQRDKIVRAITALDADVVGLMEIQRNTGLATQNLVDGLNALLGAGTYAVVPDPATGVGTDAIQVAMIYKPGRVTRVGASMSDTAAIHNRPPLAQGFAVVGSGERFAVVVNHFKSKGCSGATGVDLDAGDGQGCFNDRRSQQAQALRSFIGTVQGPSGAGTPRVLVIGDLNAYAQEDPVDALAAGGLLANQVERFGAAADRYSFVFDGEAGSLDHALATAAAQAVVTGALHWHINTDEPSVIDYNTEFKPQDLYSASPWRSSDHDPVLIGLALGAPAQPQSITFSAPVTQVAASSVTLLASASSGLPVVFSSLTPTVCTVNANLASLLVAGTCTLLADQAGSAQFLAAPQVQVSIAVTQAPQTIAWSLPSVLPLGTAPFAAPVGASSGLVVSVASLTPAVCNASAGQVTLLAAGTCTLRATQPGDGTWAAAPDALQSFTVQPAGTGGGVAEGDVPLPAWALVLLATALGGALKRRLA